MGFGLLFIGCFIAYVGSLSGVISGFTYTLGAAVILFAMRKLIYEGKLFIAGASLALVLEIASLVTIGIQVFSGSYVPSGVMVYIAEALAYSFNIVTVLAIGLLARELELSRLSVISFASVGLTPLCALLFALSEIIKSDALLPWISLAYIIIKLALIAVSLVAIFGAYMRICYEGDEKMQVEKSGFAPFDKLNDLSNKAFSGKGKGRGGKK